MFRGRSLWVVLALAVLVPALAVGWWLGSPLFLDQAVDESFPASGAQDGGMEEGAAMTEKGSMAGSDESVSEEMEGGEDGEMMEGEAAPDAAGESDAGAMSEATPETEEAMAEESVASEAATEPVALWQGNFRDVDSVHQGSGTATVYQLPDGSRALRFEEFNVTNGPDLYVTLVPHPDPMSEADAEGYVELGRLKGNVGNQNYEIPADLELSSEWSVTIWCKAFNVTFSVAPLEDA
ncbi:MAG: DM13 domain-containing protein [Ardenticatenaceae bacterium]